MKALEGLPWLAPLMVGSGIVLSSAIAALVSWPEAALTSTLTNAPRASLSNPSSGPAVYQGTLTARTERKTPRGTPAALHWYWVGKTGKYKRTTCTELASGDLVLTDGGKQARVDVFDDHLGVSFMADERTEPFGKRNIDLGPSSLHTGDVPSSVARCNGAGLEYQERMLPTGAKVEIFGCWADGEIRACPGPIAGVLAAPTLSVHTWRRAQKAHTAPRVAACLGAGALVALGLLARRMRSRRHATELRLGHDT